MEPGQAEGDDVKGHAVTILEALASGPKSLLDLETLTGCSREAIYVYICSLRANGAKIAIERPPAVYSLEAA
jgi:biotin operon repressor